MAQVSKCSLQRVFLVVGSFICWRWTRILAVNCVPVCPMYSSPHVLHVMQYNKFFDLHDMLSFTVNDFPHWKLMDGPVLRKGHVPHRGSPHVETVYFSDVDLNSAFVNNFFKLGGCLRLWSRSDFGMVF